MNWRRHLAKIAAVFHRRKLADETRQRNAKPLPNQTPGLTAAMLRNAYGDKLTVLENTRRQYDPNDRLLNDYFRTLLS